MYSIYIVIAWSLLTIAILGTIFLAAFLRLWVTPPVIKVKMGDLVTLLPDKFNIDFSGLPSFPTLPTFPTEFTLIQQRLPSKVETDKPDTVPIPEKILDYISLESEEHAQEGRKRRARKLFQDAQDWNVVYRQLQREDSPMDSTGVTRDDNVG